MKPTYEELEIGISVLEAEIKALKEINIIKSMQTIKEYCKDKDLDCYDCPMENNCSNTYDSKPNPSNWEINHD